ASAGAPRTPGCRADTASSRAGPPPAFSAPRSARRCSASPRIVGVEDPPLLAEVLGHPGADRAAGDGRVERLVERERAPVRPGGDLVGLAHRDEELPGLLGLLVDRHLYVRGQAAHDELALL